MKIVWARLQANFMLIWNISKIYVLSTFPASSLAFGFLCSALQPYLLNLLKLCPWSNRDTMLLFFLEPSIPLFPLQKHYPTNSNFLYSVKPFPNPASSQNPAFCLLLLCHSFNSTSKSNQQQGLPPPATTTITTLWTIWGQGYCFSHKQSLP